jgi:hypothetical protein
MLLELSVAIGCPVACPYCPVGKVVRAYGGPNMMSMDVFAAALANIPDDAQLSFAGFAEPFLNRDLSELMHHAYAAAHPFQVLTTGRGMTDDDVVSLLALQPYNLCLHAPDHGHAMTVTTDAAYVARVKRLAEGVGSFNVVCHGVLRDELKWLAPWMKQTSLQNRAGNVAGMKEHTATGPIQCRPAPALDHPVMLPTGEVVLCCQDWSLRHPLGNLAKQTWDELTAGDPMARLRAAMAGNGDCLCRACCYVT